MKEYVSKVSFRPAYISRTATRSISAYFLSEEAMSSVPERTTDRFEIFMMAVFLEKTILLPTYKGHAISEIILIFSR